jgi:hypothetical protein
MEQHANVTIQKQHQHNENIVGKFIIIVIIIRLNAVETACLIPHQCHHKKEVVKISTIVDASINYL